LFFCVIWYPFFFERDEIKSGGEVMKVVLVYPPFFHPSLYNLPPLGLINLGTVARRAGHEVVLLDQILGLRDGTLPFGPHLYETCAEQIIAHSPDVVAFGAQCTTYPPTVRIAERVKNLLPEARIVVGGHNASFVAERTLEKFPWIDAVVRGEGERTFEELLQAWSQKGDLGRVEGLSWRCGGEVLTTPERVLIEDLDSLPLPDYRLAAPLDEYREACDLERAIAILEVGRGCPHRCVYCSESALWRRQPRVFSIDRLVGEMKLLREHYGAECFLLAYDQFTADRHFVDAFCRRVIDEGLNRLPWYCISRLDTVDQDLLRLMRQAGCESMCYGIDSGSKRTLAFIGKQIDADMLPQRVRETTELGMVPTLSFVIGFPEERREDIDATLTLALETGIRGNSNPLLQIPTVLPGTALHARYADRLTRGVDSYFSQGIEFDHGRRLAGDDELIDADPELFSSFYNLPCAGISTDELAALTDEFPLIVQLFPKTFLLLSRALDVSPSRLFRSFRGWCLERGTAQALTGTDLLLQLPVFATQCREETSCKWRHLGDVITYEVRAIEAARPGPPSRVGNADISTADPCPARPHNILIERFSFDLPHIVKELGGGLVREDYPPAPCVLAFQYDQGRLAVTQINEFGYDFLSRCNGERSLEDIARTLFPVYGEGLEMSTFAENCRDAARRLAALRLLDPQLSTPSTRGGEYHA
jgi:radical SAM superfamily enzyme YgiQ (UPF0313 family)